MPRPLSLWHSPPGSLALATAVLVLAAPATAAAQQNAFWTNWLTATQTGNRGTVVGTLAPPGGSVTVTYDGELDFSQTTPTTNFFQPRSTFLGALLKDAEPITSDMIALSGGTGITNTFTFSAPILNPFISIVSLGRPALAVDYVFNAPLAVIAGGPSSIFGGRALTSPAPNVVRGQEGNGTIRFTGTFNSLTFTTVNGEFWSGITVGVEGVGGPSVVPEPATVVMLGTGLLALGLVARRRRKE